MYEWDPLKASSNLDKHGFDFADAVTVLEDHNAITITEDHEDEERFITLGLDGLGRLLVVVYCYRSEVIRIISARKATKRETGQYERWGS